MVDREKLQELTFLIKNGLDKESAFETAFKVITEAVQFDSGTLFAKKFNSDELEIIHSEGDDVADLAASFDFGHGKGLAGWVAEHDEPILFPTFMNENPGRNFQSFVSIPLIIEDSHIGVLNLGHKKAGFYTDDDKLGFKVLGCLLAVILDKINLGRELTDKNKALSITMEELKNLRENLIDKERLSSMGENLLKLNFEINNPLSIISGYTELLLKKCQNGHLEKEEMVEKLDIILESARNINSITQQLENYNGEEIRQQINS